MDWRADVDNDGAARVQHEVGAAVAVDDHGGEDEEAELVGVGPVCRGLGERSQRRTSEAFVNGWDCFGGTRRACDPTERRGQGG